MSYNTWLRCNCRFAYIKYLHYLTLPIPLLLLRFSIYQSASLSGVAESFLTSFSVLGLVNQAPRIRLFFSQPIDTSILVPIDLTTNINNFEAVFDS